MEKITCACHEIHEDAVESVREALEADSTYEDLATLFAAFADRTRVKILCGLEKRELCVCDLTELLDVTKSAISHQLKSLKLLNLVKARREGQNIYYSLADEHVKMILDMGFDHIQED